MIISGYHDYRTKRRADLHFIADELALRGSVFFLSLRFSLLSRFTDDPRRELWSRGGRFEQVGAVACYLWRTPIHACRLWPSFRLIEQLLFAIFARLLPRATRKRIAEADVIFVESGIALIYLPVLRRLAPSARIVYLASDSLTAIRQAEPIRHALRTYAALIDSARLPSPYLRDDVPASIPCHFIPHGIDKAQFAGIEPSPYQPESRNAVSIGSMLFDPAFFRIAGMLFPDVVFHVIGSGYHDNGTANVRYYPEMPFAATLPFIKHADFAIAAYGDRVEPYLAHTSMKLMQYGYLGVAAVCPAVVAEGQPGRFGYSGNDAASIERAIRLALDASVPPVNCLSWGDVANRLLHPEEHAFDMKPPMRSALRVA